MPVRNIYEVRQRTWDKTVERTLGYFVDDMMADNAIQACYRQLWLTAMSPEFVPTIWVPEEAKSVITQQGWDIWYPNDYNSEQPLFYRVQRQLWDQLPSRMTNFTFTLEDQLEPMVRVSV